MPMFPDVFGDLRRRFRGSGAVIAPPASAPWVHVTSPTYYNSALTSSGTNTMTRKAFIMRDTVSSLKLGYTNSYADPTNFFERPGPAIPVNIWVEYPQGTYIPVTIGGSASPTIAAGADILTDSVSVSLPNGAMFWVWTYAAGQAPWNNTDLGIMNSSYEGTSNGTSPPTTPASGFGGSPDAMGFSPIVVIAQSNIQSTLWLGDSILLAKNDTTNANLDRGYIGRIMGNAGFAYANFGIASDSTASSQFGDGTTGQSVNHKAFWRQYFNTIAIEHGLNDITSASYSLVTGYYNRLVGSLSGKRVLAMTLTPADQSTDSWATTANQSNASVVGAWNPIIRANPAAYWDANALGAYTQDGVWKVTPVIYTADGTHPSAAANVRMATDDAARGAASLASILPTVPVLNYAWAPVAQSISAVFSTTSPKFGTGYLSGGGFTNFGIGPVGAPALTISFWTRQASAHSATLVGNSYLGVTVSSSGIVSANSGSQSITGTGPTIVGSTWHHIALVSTPTGSQLYQDGVLVGSSSNARGYFGYSLGSAGRTFGIRGAGSTTASTLTNSTSDPVLDELTIWNYAMTAAQVSAEASATSQHTGTEAGLSILMHLDDATIIVGPGALS